MGDITRYLEYVASDKAVRRYGLTKEYPEMGEVTKKYREVWSEALIEVPQLLDVEIYEIPFTLDPGVPYTLKFNITKLNTDIQLKKNLVNKDGDYSLRRQLSFLNTSNKDYIGMQYRTKQIKNLISRDNINKKHAEELLNDDTPIVIADMRGIINSASGLCLIDGNHRLYIKDKYNIPLIKGYIISANVWLNYLLTERDRMFVKIYNNTNYILRYRKGLISLKECNECMYKI